MNENYDPAELELIKDMGSFTHDPYCFVLYSFPWGEGELFRDEGPDKWQKEFLCWIRDRLKNGDGFDNVFAQAVQMAVASGHGIGKSAMVAWLILWAMATHEDTKGIVTANTDTQLRTKTWPEIAKWYRLFIAKHWFVLTATALFSVDTEHEKNWRIDIVPWSENNTEAFAGLHNYGKRLLVIYDEASSIPDKIYEVTEGALTDEDTEIFWFIFGNPTRNVGRFRESFRGLAKRWKSYSIDGRTAKHTNKKQLQQWIDDYGVDSDFVKVRVRGLFPNASSKQFIATNDVDHAFGLHLRPEQYNFAPVILTCDPAFQGDDMLEIGMRQGLCFTLLETIPYNDNDIHIANKLANYEDQYRADAVFVDSGYGTGIVSAGKTMGREWTIVWFSGESADPGCLNKRAEMYKLARDWLKEGGAIPNNMELREELTAIETVARTDGKIQLESKKEYKKRIGRSPGKADVLALSFAYPVQKKSTARAQADKNGQYFANNNQRYNPLGRR